MIEIVNIEEEIDEIIDTHMDYMIAKAKAAALKSAIKTFNLELQELLANMPEKPKLVSEDTSVEVLKFSKREKNRLNNVFNTHDIKTIGDLIQLSKQDLSEIRTVGPKTIREIIFELKKLGYQLAED